jgi:hypothetical protein
VSEIVNKGTGKIVHEVTPDGAVYFGANADPGNTDESSKYALGSRAGLGWTADKEFLKDLYPGSVKAMPCCQSCRAAGRHHWHRMSMQTPRSPSTGGLASPTPWGSTTRAPGRPRL